MMGKNQKAQVTFSYKNYKGVTAFRHVEPLNIYFGSTEYHPEPQWLLYGFDIEKQEWRTFAMKDITQWRQV